MSDRGLAHQLTPQDPIVRRKRARGRLFHQAVAFDGITSGVFREGDLTGNADGKQGSIVAWFNPFGEDATGEDIIGVGKEISLFRWGEDGGGLNRKIGVQGFSVGGSPVVTLAMTSTIEIANNSGWHVACASWDLANGLGNFFLDDIDRNDPAQRILLNNVINYTLPEEPLGWGVGSHPDGSRHHWNGFLGPIWFSTQDFIDFSLVSQRRLFHNANLTPTNWGIDGTGPISKQPIVYLRGNANNYHRNWGFGGSFDPTAIKTAATSPSEL